MKLEHSFEVPASPEETLALMLDAERVVPCMPGATLVEVVDDRTWKAKMSVKLGPVGMQFLVDVKLLDRDEASHTVRLGVSGRDTRGKGGAEGTVESELTAVGTGTRVDMATDLHFSGQVAQLGPPRGGAGRLQQARGPVRGVHQGAALGVAGGRGGGGGRGTEAGLRLLTGGRGVRVRDQTVVRPWGRP